MRSVFALIFVFVFSGCGVAIPLKRSEKKLSRLDLGMTKEDVRQIIDYPDATRVAKELEDGRTLRVEEFRLYPANQAAIQFWLGFVTLGITWFAPNGNQTNPYWLHYVDGSLKKWGRAGDLQPNITSDITIHQKD